ALAERLAEGIRLRRPWRHLPEALPRVCPRRPSDEVPEEAVEGPELLPEREVGARVLDGRVDLETVPDDPRVGQERADLGRLVARHLPRIEAVEGTPVSGPLPEDRDPSEPGLRALEAPGLEEPAGVRGPPPP